ncbi:MAG: alpha/beta fold hydrolase [Chthoniobacter sp.]|nr:alpha/beta fold hydrolase [Chthoniobacter sp.]
MHPRAALLALPLLAVLFGGCGTTAPLPPRSTTLLQHAEDELRLARRQSLPEEKRAAFYLDATALASMQFGQKGTAPRAAAIYNSAVGELTTLLRTAQDGHLWNHPLTLTTGDTTYQLRFQPGIREGVWSPADFTDFKLARTVRRHHLRRSITEEGLGGTLVGIQKTPGLGPHERAPFQPKRGLVAPVTATLDFHGRTATLALLDPAERHSARIRGRQQPLAADFTAPIALHPVTSELWLGLMGLIQVEKYLGSTGLYLLHPYDPDRIPVILVHGLVSTPQMWGNVLNEVEADPTLRGRFQFWVFRYPTGNPVTYSALRCREELEKIARVYPLPHGCIMVGHSMGGLVARMQATNTGHALWDANLGPRAASLDAKLPPDHLVKQCLIFSANPQVRRLVFICVPHRGSRLALGSLGVVAMRLIKLPGTLVTTLTDAVGETFSVVGGKPIVPNSITSLSPKNPTLLAMDRLPIRAPHHSIIGDRARGDTPHSSDGVVPYWSSHLATAESERIVPGPHGSYQNPATIAELTRILHQHLRQTGRGK